MPRTPCPSEAWLLDRYRRHGDLAAREALVRRMMPLVRALALKYRGHAHVDDLEQVAAVGLVKAIDRFDATRGVPLRTFAIPTMLGELRRHLRDHGWAVHVPRPLQERVLSVTRAVERLTATNGRAPTVQAVADEVGCVVEEVLEAMQAGHAYRAESLDAPAGDGDGDYALGDTLGAADVGIRSVDSVAAARALCLSLADRDRRLLYMRFVEDLTQREIAWRLGVSQMQVSRLLRRVLDHLEEQATAA
jgi:RNA polymerase sigma-B factor